MIFLNNLKTLHFSLERIIAIVSFTKNMYNMKLKKNLEQQSLIIEILLLFDEKLCF